MSHNGVVSYCGLVDGEWTQCPCSDSAKSNRAASLPSGAHVRTDSLQAFHFPARRARGAPAALLCLTVKAPTPQASYFFRSPSPDTPSPHFVFDATRVSSGGTPRVIGVANLAGRFREDRSLRVHDTPFEERCAHAGSAWSCLVHPC